MRWTLLILLCLAACFAVGQSASEGSLFASTKPDVTVVVRKHQLGADLVEITMQRAEYPQLLLRQQAQRLADNLKSNASGLNVFEYRIGTDPKMRFARATMAVDGLIDRTTGVLRVRPIVQAFAGAPEPDTIDVLLIQFENERQTDNTLLRYSSDSVRVEAQAAQSALGVEYRVLLKSQDPDKIEIPDGPRNTVPEPAPKTAPKKTDFGLIALIAIAALALGALVYSLLLRGRPRTRAR